MANVIKPKRSSVANNVPTTSNLAAGEMGVNMADQKIYINDSTNIIQIGAGKLSGLWDVSLSSLTNGQVLQYNSTTGKWNNASGGTGTVTSITAGTGLSGGTITGAGTIAVSYGTTAGTSCQGNDSRLSDSRPASDVYAWAKASSKPTYTYSEVGAPSTTGTNASGTWGINITGSSASCTGNAATATNATNADTLDGNHASAFLTSVPAASQTVLGGVKMYLSGTTLIITTS